MDQNIQQTGNVIGQFEIRYCILDKQPEIYSTIIYLHTVYQMLSILKLVEQQEVKCACILPII